MSTQQKCAVRFTGNAPLSYYAAELETVLTVSIYNEGIFILTGLFGQLLIV